MAITRANPARTKGATITVAGRRAKSGNPVYAQPCGDCYPLIVAASIKRIEFMGPGPAGIDWYTISKMTA